jgi:hypothetical protein
VEHVVGGGEAATGTQAQKKRGRPRKGKPPPAVV